MRNIANHITLNTSLSFAYKKEDFLTSEPYESVEKIQNVFEREGYINALADYAKSIGFTGFKKMLSQYQRAIREQSNSLVVDNVTQFDGQPLELDAGDWHADDYGVWRHNGTFEERACCHPIMPVERLTNIDTGIEKLKIAFSRGKRWRFIIMDKKTLASASSITALADMGVAVTSENAKYLVKYLCDIESMNYDRIPEKNCISRLGYIEEEGFSPYVPGLVFDGDANFKHAFDAVKPKGDSIKWLELATKLRTTNIYVRLVLAASFASVLVSPLGILPFFVHLWGGQSGTGKTVALMLGASVWANPQIGTYIQTFNSTVVGRERLAAFLNHLPFCIDELQLAKDNRGKLQFDVYALAEGVGRSRGTKNGGIDRTPTWANTIITTGETPITNIGSGAGAVNRMIEIECLPTRKIVEDGQGTSSILRHNYGHAGKQFVTALYSDGNIEKAQSLYSTFFKTLSTDNATSKQAMAAAAILTADALATEWIFGDGQALKPEDIQAFLKSEASVGMGERGYRYMCDWVSQNVNKFQLESTNDVYGIIEGDWVYVIGSAFRKAAEDAGFNSSALLSWLKEKGLILTRGRNLTKGKRIKGVLTECVVMKIGELIYETDNDINDYPF